MYSATKTTHISSLQIKFISLYFELRMGTSLSETKWKTKTSSFGGHFFTPEANVWGGYVLNGSPCIERGCCVPCKTSSWPTAPAFTLLLRLLSEKRRNKMLIQRQDANLTVGYACHVRGFNNWIRPVERDINPFGQPEMTGV